MGALTAGKRFMEEVKAKKKKRTGKVLAPFLDGEIEGKRSPEKIRCRSRGRTSPSIYVCDERSRLAKALDVPEKIGKRC